MNKYEIETKYLAIGNVRLVGRHQRIYISDRTYSTLLCLPNMCPRNLSLLCL